MIKIETDFNVKDDLSILNKNYVACIGFFDGIHKYHKKIILKTKKLAKKFNYGWTIITFSKKISNFILNRDEYLYKSHIRYDFFEKEYNPDFLIEIQVNKKTILVDKDEFCNFLFNILHIRKIVIGEDFKFGHNKKGSIDDLNNFFGKNNIFVYKRNKKVSSSLIKDYLKKGCIRKINKILGDKFRITITYVKKTNKYFISSTSIKIKDGWYLILINNIKTKVFLKNNYILNQNATLVAFFYFLINIYIIWYNKKVFLHCLDQTLKSLLCIYI
ncbi:bifunctional riboflavin kinase/FMN adenylyltransferase [Spiroplasma litorale]|uniref:FAD synthase n=1 Tax=Spiroplasma litorale TaxID=216942 RepID=A0A0K1W1E2_9MOLU|nr:hypothetical protein [Spiroplasma litorale]AKX34001.1 bifunctional riboflavin kinase/FMN adenylyltransferase [Spiroplasma litorale]